MEYITQEQNKSLFYFAQVLKDILNRLLSFNFGHVPLFLAGSVGVEEVSHKEAQKAQRHKGTDGGGQRTESGSRRRIGGGEEGLSLLIATIFPSFLFDIHIVDFVFQFVQGSYDLVE